MKILKSIFLEVRLLINTFFLLPHIIVLLSSRKRDIILNEIKAYIPTHHLNRKTLIGNFVLLMSNKSYYRNLFYERVKPYDQLLFLFPKDKSLDITTNVIGENLILHHPGNSYLNAERIGKNCVIRHGVTLGNNGYGNYRNGVAKRPTIGNNVEFFPNCSVIGGVRIGNNCKIGMGVVIREDVPDNTVVELKQDHIYKQKIKQYEQKENS